MQLSSYVFSLRVSTTSTLLRARCPFGVRPYSQEGNLNVANSSLVRVIKVDSESWIVMVFHSGMQSYSVAIDSVPPFASDVTHNSTVIHRVLDGHRARSHQSLEQTYPGFPFDVFELGTLDLPLLTSRGQYVWTLKMRYKKSSAEHYWTLKFDGNRIAAFSIPRKTMSKLKDFAIDGPLVIRALQRSFDSNGERVEFEVGTTVETPYIEPTTRIRASFPASPLIIRVQYDSPDGKTTSPSMTRHWPVGFHRCGASRCKRVFATGAYCEKHHPFQRRV